MADVPYLSATQFRNSTGGWNIDDIADVELEDILLRASNLIDAYTGNRWDYHQYVDEVYTYRGLAKPISLRHTPVRIIQNMRILVGTSITNSGSLSTGYATIETTPTGPPWLVSGQLPTQFGYVIVDRTLDRLVISMTNFNTRLVGLPYVTGIANPQMLLTYTAGYDQGVNPDNTPYTAADGYSVPYPTWLQAATRITAGALIGQRTLHADGLGNVNSVRQGDTSFTLRKDTGSTIEGEAAGIIPKEALVYLNSHRRTSIVGSVL